MYKNYIQFQHMLAGISDVSTVIFKHLQDYFLHFKPVKTRFFYIFAATV